LKALVTDASLDFTLDVVRSLGRSGIEVYVIGGPHTSGLDAAFHTRYCRERLIGPHPTSDEYADFLAQTLRRKNFDILIPVGCKSTEKIARQKERLNSLTCIELAKFESIQIASSKKKTYELAETLHIPYPKTIYPQSLDEVEKVSRNIRYPVVVKPIAEGLGRPFYPRTPREFLDEFNRFCQKRSLSQDAYPMIQEYIPADSTHSFSALYQNGVCKRVFMWNEIRSSPTSGGASTFSRSIYDSQIKEYGIKLLDELKWHGVANIEFKLDKRDQKFKLMEINPRFWASIEIAIQSGINFPYLLCEMANGVQLKYSEEYSRNLKFHWIYREMAYATRNPRAIPTIVASIFDPKVRSDIQTIDLTPYIFLFAQRLLKRSRAFSQRAVSEERDNYGPINGNARPKKTVKLKNSNI
jgi:predicted ATP-grasp superfamily ATP-dependent carboligase